MIALMMLSAVACEAQPKVTVITKTGREEAIQVEVADTPAKRTKVLKYSK